MSKNRKVGLCGGVRETKQKRGLHKRAFKSPVGVLILTAREEEKEERGRKREKRLRQLCIQSNAYEFILLHY